MLCVSSARDGGAGRFCVVAVLVSAVLVHGTAVAAPRTFTFRGRGWGHGVGMSQWGARGLAERGWTGQRILTHFYRGTGVEQRSGPKEIRVGLLQEQTEIRLTADGRFDLHDRTGAVKASGKEGETWRLTPVGTDRIDAYGPDGKRRFSSASPVTARFEQHGTLLELPATRNKFKRGRIDFDINGSTAKMRAILVVPFEQYLYGVSEMPSSWPWSALIAQAVAARTYALERIETLGQNRTVCNCAVYASTADQVYAGARAEAPRWLDAVNRSRGTVVTYKGRPIKAFYSSSSGGFTENNENVWTGQALPYLRSVCDPGDYAGGANPHSNWTVIIDGEELGRRLQDAGYLIGEAQKFEARPPRGVSGRLTGVIDRDRGGVRITGSLGLARLSGATFRSILGAKSTLMHYHIGGPIRARWDGLGCGPGIPKANEFTWRNLDGEVRGSAQNFTNGRLFFNSSTKKVYWTKGAILARYDDLRSRGVDLGLPISDEYAVSSGRRSDFERGYITWNSSNGKTSAHVNR